MPSSICIIPARGGSKRIPRKNIRPFRDRPIISYAIATALESGCFDEVMVSTDDEEIADVAITFGASVPFLRSQENSNDHSDTLSVLREVLNQYSLQDKQFNMGCCLYPTALLTRAESLREGYELLQSDTSLAYAMPVMPFGYPIQRAVFMEKKRLAMLHPEHYKTRSQDLPKTYHDAGQWYWFRSQFIHENVPVLGPGTAGVIISEMEAQDIDDEEDWRIAELKYEFQKRS